ncbi:MAG: cytochrome d ubiquinol oxidase subunit II [Woeseiaceae bacterium]|nr:cytochrome d ubiquinol oxidase subunit II [Woeseiaceae bacterium]
MSADFWLPVIFAGLMALAMLIYVVLDGYDLGVGVLLNGATDSEKDAMIASIGPFWDANETWLVLGVGILLIAFPMAHGVILTSLYLPVAAMLVGLILRGVAFDFRVKAREPHKPLWDRAFFAGSLLASLAQGFMLGHYITGFAATFEADAFSMLIGISVAAGYGLLGATWLIMKSEHDLQRKAVRWAQRALWLTAAGIAGVSIATPLVSTRIFDKWFSFPQFLLLSQIPAISIALILTCHNRLRKLSKRIDGRQWVPFALAVSIFVLAFAGLAYSLFPYLVIDEITIWDAASATNSLQFVLWGVLITLPAILGYTVFAYRVFWGKTRDLSYD